MLTSGLRPIGMFGDRESMNRAAMTINKIVQGDLLHFESFGNVCSRTAHLVEIESDASDEQIVAIQTVLTLIAVQEYGSFFPINSDGMEHFITLVPDYRRGEIDMGCRYVRDQLDLDLQ